ncbi:MAG TPA: toprim domain-containing protein [Thermoplasmata archaeon]|nr:toprim domain-containing protein [Thermoplasmata archaeon]
MEKVFQELDELSERWPVIVEGARDVAALRKLGITKNVTPLNKGKPVFSFCEDLSKKAKVAVILTDWDRRGGQLARMLKDGLEANGVKVNDRVRTQIVILSKKEVKDMESMPTFIDRLKAMALSQRL